MSGETHIVRARVVARVLGVKLLRLDARVDVAPARPPVRRGGERGSLSDATRYVGESAKQLAELRSNGSEG